MTAESKRRRRERLANIRTITPEGLRELIQEECEEAKMIVSIASNLARPGFMPGLQPDGSVIEI